MKRWLTGLFWLLGFLVVVEVIFFAPEHLQSQEPVPQENSPQKVSEAADQIMGGVHLVEAREEHKSWELWANTAKGFSGQGAWKLRDVKVVFLNDEGIRYTVRGDRGTVMMETKDMQIEGNVVTTTSNDYRIDTEAVTYTEKTRILKGVHPVKIIGPKDENGYRLNLNGIGLRTFLGNSQILIPKDVKGTKQLDVERVMHIKSNQATLSGQSKVAVFSDNVTMDVDTFTVTSDKARFVYGADAKNLEKIEVSENVRLSDESKWATSEFLDILLPEDQMVLWGKPRVVQNNDEIRGEKIVFLNGGKQVQVLSGDATVGDQLRKDL